MTFVLLSQPKNPLNPCRLGVDLGCILVGIEDLLKDQVVEWNWMWPANSIILEFELFVIVPRFPPAEKSLNT